MGGRLAAITVVTLLATSGGLVEAGEIVFKNGTRLSADLASQALLVSTGSDLVEIRPDQVAVLAAGEIRTRDGRTIRGALVGGTIRARTTYGELTVALDDLVEFRADAPAPPPVAARAQAAAAPVEARPQAPAAPVEARAQAAAAAPSEPVPPAREPEPIRRGLWDTTMGIARSVTDGVDRIHDGFVAAGRTIRDGMFSAARAVRRTFTD